MNSWRTDLRFDGPLSGAAAALITGDARGAAVVEKARKFGPLIQWGALALLAASFVFALPHLLRFATISTQLVLVVAIIVVLAEGCGGKGAAVFDLAPVQWLGRISYSLYLWQQPFFFSTDRRLTIFPLNILVSVGLAAASYYWIEMPALRWRDATSRSRRAAIQRAAAVSRDGEP